MDDLKTQWVKQAEDINQACIGLLNDASRIYTVKTMLASKSLALMLMSRSLGNFKGAFVLLDNRLMTEARVLIRCCFENAFWMVRLLAEGEDFAKRMQDDELYNREALGKLALEKHKGLDEAVEQGLRRRSRDLKGKLPKDAKLYPQKVAQGSLLDIAYALYCQLSADAAHPSLTALNRHLGRRVSDAKVVIGIVPEPKEDEVVQTLDWACHAQLAVYAGLTEILTGTTDDTRLHELTRRQITLSGVHKTE